MTNDNLADDGSAAQLAAEIRRLRKGAGLSQQQLAARVRYTRQYVSLSERVGRNLPSRELVRALDAQLNADGHLVALREQARAEQRAARNAAASTQLPVFASPVSLASLTATEVERAEAGSDAPASRFFAGAFMANGWHRPMLSASAERARDFLMQMEVPTVGSETLGQLGDDVRRLVVAYQVEPLDTLLADMVDTQRRAFTLLEGRQRAEQARELHLLAGVASGLMARASHDLGASDEAMTHARAAYVCADNAGHNGLRAWTRGLQALVAYWAGNVSGSVRFAQRGAEPATQTSGTARVWLASLEARSLAALGRLDDARAAVDRATEARDHATGDELDELGGLCTFSRARELYYAADALNWAGAAEADQAAAKATEAIDAYDAAPRTDRAFATWAGARCALAIARISRSEIDGASEAMTPVLDLPTAQRIHGIVTSVGHVKRALAAAETGQAGDELADRMDAFATNRLVIAG